MTEAVTNDALNNICELILTAAKKSSLRKAVLSKCSDKSIQKAVITLRQFKDKVFIQTEYFHKDNKVTHKNIQVDDSVMLCEISKDFSQINLFTSDGDCEYRRSSSGKCVLLGGDKLKRRMENSAGGEISPITNNREKKYILNGSEPFLKYLDVSDENGRVYDRRQPKFRQINRFLELIRDVEDKLPQGSIRI